MHTADLREAVERHRRVLRCTTVHLLADERETLVGSSLVSGHAMRSRLGASRRPLNCVVNAEVLTSMLSGHAEVELSDSGSDLHVRCGSNRGSVPSQSEEPPDIPAAMGENSQIRGRDLEWLQGALKRISLGKCQSDGSTNIENQNGHLCVCTYDEVYGAFTWHETDCQMRVGLMPSDASLLASMARGDDLAVAMSNDNRLVVTSGPDVLVLPCIQAGAQPRDVVLGDTRHAWTTRGDLLQEAVKSVGAVARSKDAGPVRIMAQRGNGVRIGCSGSVGSTTRSLRARVVESHVAINCSIVLLQDVVERISGDQEVEAWVEPGDRPSPRLVLQAKKPDTTYVLLTSSG